MERYEGMFGGIQRNYDSGGDIGTTHSTPPVTLRLMTKSGESKANTLIGPHCHVSRLSTGVFYTAKHRHVQVFMGRDVKLSTLFVFTQTIFLVLYMIKK